MVAVRGEGPTHQEEEEKGVKEEQQQKEKPTELHNILFKRALNKNIEQKKSKRQ